MRYQSWVFLLAGMIFISALWGCSGEKKKVESPTSVPPPPTGAGKEKPPAASKAEK